MKPVTYIIEIVPETRSYRFIKTVTLATGKEKTTETFFSNEGDLIDVTGAELRARKKTWKNKNKNRDLA